MKNIAELNQNEIIFISGGSYASLGKRVGFYTGASIALIASIIFMVPRPPAPPENIQDIIIPQSCDIKTICIFSATGLISFLVIGTSGYVGGLIGEKIGKLVDTMI